MVPSRNTHWLTNKTNKTNKNNIIRNKPFLLEIGAAEVGGGGGDTIPAAVECGRPVDILLALSDLVINGGGITAGPFCSCNEFCWRNRVCFCSIF